MRTVALISGGKDSCYNMMQCVGAGHTIVALANLQPIHKDEMDSYMYQTVGHQGIDLYAEAMGLPLYREAITGNAVNQGKNYHPTANDEVEDLFRLLSKVKNDLDVEAVAVGAILSDYQRIRVENVCHRLGLVSLAYLWRRNQKELLQEMIASGVEAVIIKVAALGLDPRVHLGLSLREIQPHLLVMQDKYGLNVCGEGGEYETFTLDCPLFKKKLVIDEKELVLHTDDPVAPVGYLNLKLHLAPKDNYDEAMKLPPTVKNPLDFVNDLSDSVFSDISDIELSETEIESIEKLEKEEKKKQNELNPLLTYSGDKVTSVEVEYQNDEDSIEVPAGYTYEQAHSKHESLPILDHRTIYGNKHGWYFIGGIVGEGVDTKLATENAMKKLISLLDSQSLLLTDVCSVNIYMRDMKEYVALNEVYVNTFNFPNPPTRVCVQVPLPADVGLIFDAVAHKSTFSNTHDCEGVITKERITMHVQGISHWAPANIGPYSQAVKVGEVMGTCGQIALVPGTLRLASGGPRAQSALSLRHLTRVLRALHPRAHIRSVVQGSSLRRAEVTRAQSALSLRHLTRVLRALHPRAHIRSVVQSVCYVTHGAAVSEARRQLERRTAGAIVQYAVVQALPRDAQVEWHAWAHTDNNRFEYEETGCNVGDYKVAITRRWNYENTVAAFVCYVATGSSPSTCQLSFPSEEVCTTHRMRAAAMTQQQIEDVLEYALRKLTQERDMDATHAVKMRILYQVWSAPSMSIITEAVSAVRGRTGVSAAVTAVPVLALHNAFTFLSISGLRLDE